MSRLLILIAVVAVPTTSFGQEWSDNVHRAATPGLADIEFAQPIVDALHVIPRDVYSAAGCQSQSALPGAALDWTSWGNLWQETGVQSTPGHLGRLEDLGTASWEQPNSSFASSGDLVIRGQSPSGGGGGGAGAAEATDPSVPLTQLQLQNLFTPETYDASGYSNTVIIQPVIPLSFGEDGFFPYHIIRPTVPIIAPTADPDGPIGVEGGLGDTTIVDVFFHPSKELKTNFGIGYVGILPTRTHPALGRGEWQLGPSVAVISRAIPKWVIGGLVEAPFSLESDAYAIQMQGIALRLLPDEWFVGWGDQILKFDDQNGGYEIPLSMQLGKVVKVGDTPMKLFVEPIYTPEGLRSGPGGAEWGIKLNLTILFPGAKLDAPLWSVLSGHGGSH